MRLHSAAEINLQPARQLQAKVPLQYESDTSLSGLAVNPYYFLIRAPDILRINWQIGHLPGLGLIAPGQAFLDGILMAARESREH